MTKHQKSFWSTLIDVVIDLFIDPKIRRFNQMLDEYDDIRIWKKHES